MVVMAPPLMAVVPPVLVVTEAAVTAALKVVVPVEFTAKAPRAPFAAPPTTPVKVTLPEPEETVSALALDGLLLTVEVKATALLVVVEVTAVVRTTGPV